MDDIDSDSAGFSGWAWYEIGRMSARRSQQRAKTRDMLVDALSPARPEMQNLIVDQANRNIQSWMNRCKALEGVIETKEGETRELREQIASLTERLDLALKCYEAVSSDSHERQGRIEELELELEQLRKGSS